MNLLQRFATLLRHLLQARGILLFLAYAAIFVTSLALAYQVRFEFAVPPPLFRLFLENLLWVVPLKLVLMFSFGQFAGLVSYFRLPDLNRLLGALTLNAGFLIYLWYFTNRDECPPRSVVLIDFVFSLLMVVAFRIFLRVLRERYMSQDPVAESRQRRVAIVGAGDAGALVASDLLSRRGTGLRPVVFLDDDSSKWRRQVHGIPVVDSPDNLPLIRNKYGVEVIVIAMPSAPTRRVKEIVDMANSLGLKTEIVPSLADITSGRVKASRVRPIEIEDLLGRDSVCLNSDSIRSMIENKVVLVTGAGGSIGSELSRQVAAHNPQRLLLLDQAEIQLFELENRLQEEGLGGVFLPIMADVADASRMRALLSRYQPKIIFHAAAHKHVPIMERHPGESLKNNTFATARLADLAIEAGVERFVLISTDKAINPTSVMGATKRLAELYLQSVQAGRRPGTRLMAVRFGNVLGSSGSVVPIFRKQIADGGPVRVTHPEMTRYFMTIPEAVGLVLQCATQGEGGEIFVLNMGTPVKIVDLARQMIELSGFRPGIDIEIKFTGLRPGEKLFEELRHSDERHAETAHPKILRFTGTAPELPAIQQFLDALRTQVDTLEANDLKRKVKEFVPEYVPHLD